MRSALAAVAAAAACLVFAAPACGGARLSYMDDPGGGGTYGVFYVCTLERCGWWFCWPGQPCYPI